MAKKTNKERKNKKKQKTTKAEKIVEDADLIFCVDFNGLGRVENLQYALRRSKAIRIMLDHHPEPEILDKI